MSKMQAFILKCLLLLAVLILPMTSIIAPAVHAEDKQMKIGVLAKRGTEHCLQKWSATAEYLSQNISGYSFSIIPLNFDEIIPATRKSEIDFVLTNPAYYVSMEINQKVDRIATLINKDIHNKPMTTFGGVLFTQVNRQDISSMKDLVGKKFISVAPKALGAWLAVLREMKWAGINPQKDFASLSFVGTQDATVYAIRDGKADAGSVRTSTLERMTEEGKIKLTDFKIIHKHLDLKTMLPELHLPHSTRSYPEWPLAKLNHISDELAKQIANTLINMPANNLAAQNSHSYGWSHPLNYQPVHNCLRELGVDPYFNYGKYSAVDILKQYWPHIMGGTFLIVLFLSLSIRLKKLNLNLNKVVTAKNHELALRQRIEEKLKETQQLALLGSWERDIVNNSLWWSNETYRIFGVQSDAKITLEQFFGTIHPDDRQMVHDSINEAVAQGHSLQLDYRIMLPNGELRFLHEESKSIYNDKMKVVQSVGSVQDVTKQKKTEIEREKLISELQKALEKIETLQGILPICASCKKIRDDKGHWNQIETYIRDHSEAEFSHSICPECAKKLYPKFYGDKTKQKD